MDSTTWRKAKQIFHEALEKSGPERDDFVASACGGDRDLRLQVESLLAAHDEAGEFLVSPTMSKSNELNQLITTITASSPPEAPGAMVGPYKLLQVIGEGGFGIVYMAEQEQPVRRRVALKIIKLGMDTKQVIARFEAERQALAMMDHPNIARVLDAGATETGRPYFVMELVKGISITEYCDSNTLSTRERLDLFMNVCSAIQHAHQKGIVHRDLKPSNVMVTLHDGDPVPKVIDFGIAKATHQRLTEKTLFTQYGQFIGTPVYMSPEQAEMSGLDVDTRSDIYSLGVLLYELLTGTTPFDPEILRGVAYEEIQRMIREEEPPKPSTRLSTLGGALTSIAKHRRTDSNALTRLIRGDLDWIVMMALEKSRTRRYDSASEFAADIGRYLADEPIMARPPSTMYKLRKYVKKHKGPVTAVAAVVVTALFLGSAAFWQGLQAQRQARRVRASSILTAAESTEDPLLKALLTLELAKLPELPGGVNVARQAADFPLPVTVFRAHEGYVTSAAFSPEGKRVVTGARDGTARVWRTDGTGETVVLRGHRGGIWDVAFSPDGTRVLTACDDDNTARVWSADGTGEPIILQGHETRLWRAAFSPDGTRVVTASQDGTARVWRADGNGEPVVLRGHEGAVRRAVFDEDGFRVLTASKDGTARVWRADGNGEPVILRGHDGAVWDAVFNPDGTRVVTASQDGTARLWRADGSGKPVILRHDDAVYSAAFSPDGTRIVTGSSDWTARVWLAEDTGDPVILRGHEGGVWRVHFNPDGTRVITASGDGTARVWRVDGAGTPIVLGRHQGLLNEAAFSPDGTRIVTASVDGTVRVWPSETNAESVVFRGHAEALASVGFNPDGTRVITSGDGTTQIWRPDGTGDPVVLDGHYGSFSPDGSRVVTTLGDEARVWRANGAGETIVLRGHEAEVWRAAFSPDGSKVATASQDGTVRVWSADGTGEPVVLRGHDAGVARVAFSPDGTRVIANCIDGSVRVWRADRTGEPTILPGPEMEVLTSVYFLYDGPDLERRLVRVFWDGTTRVWRDQNTNEPVVVPSSGSGLLYDAYWSPEVTLSPDGTRAFVVKTGSVWPTDGSGEGVTLPSQWDLVNAAFSPDGKRLVGSSLDALVRVWTVDRIEEPVVFADHTSEVYHAAFSPDGKRVVSGSFDQTARVWNADGRGEAVVLRGHQGAVWRVAFSPDGTRVASASWDGTARVWRVTWSALLEHLRENVHTCLTVEQRMKFLAESSSEAGAAFAACERGHGREPASDVIADSSPPAS